MAKDTIYFTMSRDEMLDIRAKAETFYLPSSLVRGQRIAGYREWKTSNDYTPGFWRAVVVLADGMRIEIDEAER
jgi:hypothetical protein